jgi:hypothetical protein
MSARDLLCKGETDMRQCYVSEHHASHLLNHKSKHNHQFVCNGLQQIVNH